ncbi:MAG: hypothetical protein KGL54_01920, partial [Sphingomonadales bacterium]|nr:hypothetical protein [Sphingomonadales bacterium]
MAVFEIHDPGQRMKTLRTLALALSLAALCAAQQPTNVQKGGVAGTNNITADLNIGAGRTLTISSGGTLNAAGGSTITGVGAAWGSITGTLSAQTDLQAALNAKLASATAASTYQPLSAALTIYAGLTPSANVQTLLGAADYAAFRSSLGLGTLATQSGTFSGTSSGTNTGDQTLSITGDVTAAGSTGVLTATVTKLNGTSLAGLATGILKNTTTTGVPSIAVAGDFPTLNQSTTGSAATLTTARNIGGSSFNGSADVTSFPSPGAIGGTTPAAGTFTTLANSGTFRNTSTTDASDYSGTTGALGTLGGLSVAKSIWSGGNVNVAAGQAYNYNGANVIIAQTALGNYFFGGAGNLTGTGYNNTAFGVSSLSSNTAGGNNIAVGNYSLSSNATGTNNIVVGRSGLPNLGAAQTAGAFSVGTSYTITSIGTTDFTLIGASANTVGVVFNATGAGTGTGTAKPAANSNTAIGYNTGAGIVSGSGNTILGALVTGLAPGLTNNIILANGTGAIKAQNDGTNWTFTGTITGTAATQSPLDNSTKLATTAYADAAVTASASSTTTLLNK